MHSHAAQVVLPAPVGALDPLPPAGSLTSTEGRQVAASSTTVLTMSPEIDLLVEGLAAAQLAFTRLEKNRVAHVVSKRTDTKYDYGYADLGAVLRAVRPALNEQGIALLQFPETRQNSIVVETFIGRGKQYIRHRFVMPADVASLDPQEIGKAISFTKRYSLSGIFAIAPEEDDDDAQGAHHAAQSSQSTWSPTPQGPTAASRPLPLMPERASARRTEAEDESRRMDLVDPSQPIVHNPVPEPVRLTVTRCDPRKTQAGATIWLAQLSDGRQVKTMDRKVGDVLDRYAHDGSAIDPRSVQVKPSDRGGFWIDGLTAR